MTKEEAIAKYESNWWLGKTPKEIADFQLYEDKLCMPFDKFHEAFEKALGRSVWTHEFADIKGLRAEYEGRRKPEDNPIESATRILTSMGRKDLVDNMIVIDPETLQKE